MMSMDDDDDVGIVRSWFYGSMVLYDWLSKEDDGVFRLNQYEKKI